LLARSLRQQAGEASGAEAVQNTPKEAQVATDNVNTSKDTPKVGASEGITNPSSAPHPSSPKPPKEKADKTQSASKDDKNKAALDRMQLELMTTAHVPRVAPARRGDTSRPKPSSHPSQGTTTKPTSKDQHSKRGESAEVTDLAGLYNAQMQASLSNRNYREVHTIWQQMLQKGVKPNEYSYLSLMEAYEQGEQAQRCLAVLDKMVAENLVPTHNHYTFAIGVRGMLTPLSLMY
jgi:pentatricopeptide repeat protein